jgi:PAS domain S-box-containing protein
MKLRSHLILLVIAALLPVLIFAGVMLMIFSNQQRSAVETGLLNTARALSLAVDRELAASVRTLETLATSAHLESGDLRKFYEQAKRVLEVRPGWYNMLLVDPSGQQLVNMRRPFGSPLPRSGAPEVIQRVSETGQPVISNLFWGHFAQAHLVGVDVPVIRDGRVRYVVTTSTYPAFLLKLLKEQNIPPDWLATIIDRNKIVLARTQDFEKFLGKQAMPLFATKSSESEEGFFRGISYEGVAVYTAFHRSNLSGWTIGLAIPVSAVNAPLYRSLLFTAAGGFALLLVGIGLATLFGRRIANPIATLSTWATGVGRGETPQIVATPISEVNELARALDHAALLREQILSALETRMRQQAAVAELGQSALAAGDLSALMDKAVALVAKGLNVEYCKVLELLPGEKELILRAGVGWKEGQVGRATVSAGLESQAGFTLLSNEPVIVEDLHTETRFSGPPLLRDHEVVSGISTILRGKEKPYGVLGAHTTKKRTFTREDVNFLRAIANVLAAAIERKRAEEALCASETRYQLVSLATNDAIWDWNLETDKVWWNEGVKTLFGYSAEEVEHNVTWWEERIHPEDREKVLSSIHAVIDSGRQAWADEYRYRCCDGSYAYVIDRGYVVHGQKGNPVRMIGCMTDVTARKRAEQRLQQYAERLQTLSRRLVEVQEIERRNIARELHDEIGQALTGLKLALEMNRRLPANRAKANLSEVEALVNDLIAQVRDLSLNLRPAMLDDLGLLPTLVWHFERYTAQTHVQVSFTQTGLEGRRFAPDVETTVYRIVQEALTNVARHAGVSEVEVGIWADQNTLSLQIKDRGVGFDADTVRTAGISGGLSGMRERAITLGGQLLVDSARGAGALLKVQIPLTHSRENEPGRGSTFTATLPLEC